MAKQPRVQIQFDPGLAQARQASGPFVHSKMSLTRGFDYYDGPDHSDPDEKERKKKLAIMLSMKDKLSRPFCPFCYVRRVARVGKGMNAPLDSCCGVCGKVSVEKGYKHRGSI